jgi:hypothetical protein
MEQGGVIEINQRVAGKHLSVLPSLTRGQGIRDQIVASEFLAKAPLRFGGEAM